MRCSRGAPQRGAVPVPKKISRDSEEEAVAALDMRELTTAQRAGEDFLSEVFGLCDIAHAPHEEFHEGPAESGIEIRGGFPLGRGSQQ
jgi:hypothetical protein